MKSTNPQSKPINQKRGPTTGNENPGSKRSEFLSEKDRRSSEKSKLANMVTSALEMRGRGQRGKDDPALESLHDNTNEKRSPSVRKGNK